ncbi:MAG: thioredoxin domain-containing protein [Leptospirales bacterium]|nr:thioredoxin domain-containing protein [Leptospirales bacterium]
MKKYVYTLIGISIIGAVLSTFLWIAIYYPSFSLLSDKFYNPYIAVASSAWSKILAIRAINIPLPVLGMLMYLCGIFILLVADYASGRYYIFSAALMIPFAGIVLVLSAVSLVMIILTAKVFPILYVLSILLNIILLAVFIKFYLSISAQSARSLATALAVAIKDIFDDTDGSSDKKAATAYATLFVFLLASTLLCLDYTMKLRNPARVISEKDMNIFLDNFYTADIEKIDLPESKIRYGSDDAKITIHVFTDFLCNACYNFYQTEKYIVSRFGNQVKFLSYHYPLDTSCNNNIGSTVYDNSCLASKSIQAAAEMNILEKFMIHFFKRHKEISHSFDIEKALMIFGQTGLGEKEKNSFKELLNSAATEKKIAEDLAAAKKLEIDGTPTIFINGRRISGVPPKEMLEALIEKELTKIIQD